MTRLPELHRQLVEAARRQEAQHAAADRPATGQQGTIAQQRTAGQRRTNGRPWHAFRRDGRRLAWRPNRLRLLIISLAALLVTTTIALAAGGVIPIGSSVPPTKLHADRGLGVPVKAGGSRLLPMRVADPVGGLPWGMRIVRTGRELVCLQVGRVQGSMLGELGIDGAFHDDGELHPLPASALPGKLGGTVPYVSNGNTQCALAGQAIATGITMPTSAIGQLPRSAKAIARREAMPKRDMRSVYFGLLGPQAVSVTYRDAAGGERTQPVVSGSGAYLIVLPANPKQSFNPGTLITAYGDVAPGPREPIEKIAYRIDGKLCERGFTYVRGSHGAWLRKGPAADVAHLCPTARYRSPTGGMRRVELHRPLHTHLQIDSEDVVTGLRISFQAPYAVRSARSSYGVFLPQVGCHPKPEKPGAEGGAGYSLTSNVRKGATVSTVIRYPFRVRHLCGRKAVTVQVIYEASGRTTRTIVGKVTVEQPPGTRNGTRRGQG